ncbi:helix-turn-helix domain-containing protein [Oceanobacter sp. 4_MG-2023]|uniref:helix-turn-helix domain-containing protein n=1 Tax=Oceanobacter sp. 4_MG-2023 TaxID=3062623 RepID=UPI002734EA0D|nr:helix-turn-helix domain-containing protein [Oceanobacter sp. 4_MG-2023]MDP2549490.1 helix-turn-helix domain-containing protein [Oceanobacter sp. 4_MG-2023]
MAKPPSLPPTSTGLTQNEVSMLDQNNITVTVRNGIRTVDGYDHNGQKVTIKTHISNNNPSQGNGFRSQTMTVCDQLSIEERRKIAKQLKSEEKLSQKDIADRLGVSQKTISTDLNS